MLSLLKIPENCICNKNISLDKVFTSKEIEQFEIESINWYASIKPCFINSQKVVDNTFRCEEIQVIVIKINKQDLLLDNSESEKVYSMLKLVFRSIKYHMLLVINYADKYKLVTCRFKKGKVNSSDNILNSIIISDWIHREYQSEITSNMLNEISAAINSQEDLLTIYNRISNCVANCAQCKIRKRRALIYIDYLHTRIRPRLGIEVLKECSVYKVHPLNYKGSRYSKAELCKNYNFEYNAEEVWYCFMKNEELRASLQRKNIKNFTELDYYAYESISKNNDD